MHVMRPVGLSFLSASGADPDPVAWDVNAVYQIGARVGRLGSEYVNSLDGNTGLPPEDEVQELEGARWIRIGPVNSQAFLDGSPSKATRGTSPLVLEVEAAAQFTDLCLVGIQSNTATVEVFDSGGTLAQSQTFHSGAVPVSNYWDWLHTEFHTVESRRILEIAGGPGYTVRISLWGEAPALGEVYAGKAFKVGNTLMGPRTRVAGRSFSNVDTNAFGYTTIQKRATTRDVTYHVHAKRAGFERVAQVLDDLDGVRIVSFAKREGWSQFINVGLLQGFTLAAELPNDHKFEVTVKGIQ